MRPLLLAMVLVGCTPMTRSTASDEPWLVPYDAGPCCAPVCWRLFVDLPDGGPAGYGPCCDGPADCGLCGPAAP
jgi:hypothetical protein